MCAYVYAQLLSRVQLFCDLMDCSQPGFSVHGISQATILGCHFLLPGSSQPRDRIHVSWVSCIGRWILYHWATWEAPSQHTCAVLSCQSCLTLCNLMDCSPPDSCPWDYPGKNTGVGCHFLLQRIFPAQESNLHLLQLLYWQEDSLPLYHLAIGTK